MNSTCSIREQFVKLACNRPYYVADTLGISIEGNIKKVVEECINKFETCHGNDDPTKIREFKNKKVILSAPPVLRSDESNEFMIFKIDWSVKDFDTTQ